MLDKADDREYGLIILALTSDAIPAHLLTREAVGVYMSKLQHDGVIAFHITNQHVELSPILAAAAHDRGDVAMICRDDPRSEMAVQDGWNASDWVVLARTEAALGNLRHATGWRRLRPEPGDRAWTDDFSDIISLLWK